MHDNKSLCCTISVTLNAAFDKNNFHVLWFIHGYFTKLFTKQSQA